MNLLSSKPKGLAFKLSLSILSATAIIIFGILYYNYHFSKRLLLESARETAEQLTNSTMIRMESVLISAQRVPEALLLFLNHPKMNPNSMNEMLKFVMQNKPEIFGSAVAFAPYALDPEIKGYAPYCYRDGEEYDLKDLGTESYDYFYQDWYVLPRDLNRAVWTEPYFDIGGGNVLMTTYSMPFYTDTNGARKFRGVATADLSLKWLEDVMNSIKVLETGYVYLVSEKGTLITHPISAFQMKNLEELAVSSQNMDMQEIAEAMKTSDEGFMRFKSMVDGRQNWMYFSTLPQTKWHMAVVFPEEELFAGLQNLFIFTILLGILGILLLSLIVILFSARITRPLRRLTATAGEIGGGNFNLSIVNDQSTREISQLGNAFNRMQAELKDYVKNLETTTAAKERFESELNIAHEIQQGMIPKKFPPYPGRNEVDIYAVLEPARQVGGDFYDYFFLDDENLCFAIGDVSDKGVPAALMMAMTLTLFRAKSDLEHSINQLVESINHDISKDNVNLMFITFFMGILNLKTGKMVYCNAGHNYPVILKKDGSQQFLSETHGIPLGINEQQGYKSAMMNIEKGDTLILYTDGITEALSIDGDFYGDERLEKVIGEKCPGLDTKKAARIIMEDVTSFTRNPEKSDDITLMILSYYPENKQVSQDGKQ